MKKRIFLSIILSINILATLLTPVFAEPDNSETTKTELVANSESAILIDMKSGEILFSKNEHDSKSPASITKIMTAILTLESGLDLSDVVTATSEAIDPITRDHSNMGILVGEELTIENLLYGLLVDSANDAANVLAVKVGGSLDGFVQMMNDKAAELGMKNTRFKNAHGFDQEGHKTTAYDISIMARHAMQNPTFREIVKEDQYVMEATNKYKETRYLSSTNHLVSKRKQSKYFYQKAIGIKTGYTDEAGNCLVSAAVDGQTELLAVVLKSNSEDGTAYSFVESKELLEYGFNNFEYKTIATTGTVVSSESVYEAKKDICVALTPDKEISAILPIKVNMEEIKPEITLNEKFSAPIKKGDVLGSVVYTYKGKQIGTAQLIAFNDVEKDMIAAIIHLIFKTVFNPFIILIILVIGFFIFTSRNNQKKRRKNRRSRMKHVRQ